MRYLLLALLLILPVKAMAFGFGSMMGGAVSSGEEITYIHEIKCEDNAASTVVTNDGTGSDWASALTTTASFTTTTAKEGTRAFDIISANEQIFSSTAWTDEYFEMFMWVRWHDVAGASGNPEVLMQVGDRDIVIEANEAIITRETSGELMIRGFGNSGDYGLKTSTDAPTWAVNTWYFIKVTIDARANDWDGCILEWGTTEESLTPLTLGAWSNSNPAAAVFTSPLPAVSADSSVYDINAIVDHVRYRSL